MTPGTAEQTGLINMNSPTCVAVPSSSLSYNARKKLRNRQLVETMRLELNEDVVIGGKVTNLLQERMRQALHFGDRTIAPDGQPVKINFRKVAQVFAQEKKSKNYSPLHTAAAVNQLLHETVRAGRW